MKRRIGSRICLWLTVACVLSAGSQLQWVSAAEPEYTLEEITAQLKEWQAKIVTLRLQMREEGDPHSKMATDGALVGGQRVGFFDWVWTDTGAIRSHRWGTYDGPTRLRALRVDGGRRSWASTFRH